MIYPYHDMKIYTIGSIIHHHYSTDNRVINDGSAGDTSDGDPVSPFIHVNEHVFTMWYHHLQFDFVVAVNEIALNVIQIYLQNICKIHAT